MKFEHQAPCPHCGQVIIISTDRAEETEEILAQQAVLRCKCPEAGIQRGMRETDYAIREMLGDGGLKYFDKTIPDDEIEAVRKICEMILRENIENATLVLSCGDVIKLAPKGGVVKIRRTSKRQMEL